VTLNDGLSTLMQHVSFTVMNLTICGELEVPLFCSVSIHGCKTVSFNGQSGVRVGVSGNDETRYLVNMEVLNITGEARGW
jgi:hypothetical protein